MFFFKDALVNASVAIEEFYAFLKAGKEKKALTFMSTFSERRRHANFQNFYRDFRYTKNI